MLDLIGLFKSVQGKKERTNSHILKAGFTLIELSIVLVIVGLLIGGVLVGKDLIKAAEIRSQINQIGKYNLAVNTFKAKYNQIPGDMLSTEANAVGFFASTNVNSVGWGDGNGSITSNNVTGTAFQRGEPLIFWRHLSEAKLIDGSYSITTGAAAGNIDASGQITVLPTTVAMINAHFPKAAIGNGASIVIGAWNNSLLGASGGQNYWAIAGMNSMDSTAGYFTGSTNPFSSQQAYNIDTKMDDGLPNSGIVRATNSTNYQHPIGGVLPGANSSCVSGNNYIASGTAAGCSLQIKFQ